MGSFWDWLVGEAGAGWIVGFIGLLLSLYAWLHRECAPKVIVQEVNSIRLLDIHSTQRESLSVFYTDSEGQQVRVQDLQQEEVVIYNNGTVDVREPLQLVIRFHQAGSKGEEFSGFWQLVSDDPGCTMILAVHGNQ